MIPVDIDRDRDPHLSLLFGTALLPAAHIEEIALTTLPWEFLVADSHVFRQGFVGAVQVLLYHQILQNGKDHHRAAHKDGNLDPAPQFDPLLRVRLVRVGGHDFLLVRQTRSDLRDGLGFHLRLGSKARNRSDRSGAAAHVQSIGSGPSDQTASESTSDE
jgi:hypothetical protein